jgi:cell division protein FtsN
MIHCPTCRRVRQRGGTFLGLIIGVLLGLAGALAVAVYITKVPVPFVDRVISRPATDEAAEAERNRNWNPNAILNGKSTRQTEAADKGSKAKEADAEAKADQKADAKGEAKTADAKPGKADAKEPKAQPEATVDGQGKVYSTDPLADMATGKNKGKVVSTTPREEEQPTAKAEPFTYFVQVGAFRTPEDAQAQRAKLMLMGLDAKISEREQSGRTVYRVRLGPYERLTDAEKMKDEIAPSGLETALVRVQR